MADFGWLILFVAAAVGWPVAAARRIRSYRLHRALPDRAGPVGGVPLTVYEIAQLYGGSHWVARTAICRLYLAGRITVRSDKPLVLTATRTVPAAPAVARGPKGQAWGAITSSGTVIGPAQTARAAEAAAADPIGAAVLALAHADGTAVGRLLANSAADTDAVRAVRTSLVRRGLLADPALQTPAVRARKVFVAARAGTLVAAAAAVALDLAFGRTHGLAPLACFAILTAAVETTVHRRAGWVPLVRSTTAPAERLMRESAADPDWRPEPEPGEALGPAEAAVLLAVARDSYRAMPKELADVLVPPPPPPSTARPSTRRSGPWPGSEAPGLGGIAGCGGGGGGCDGGGGGCGGGI
ncbi:hypothetical protein [Streptomyces sp. NPDC002054]|uniref:hypothetical protein n=1 Tax=Streptomyces sp. NPDC002054 TaxID=3154663 RepID=UPI003320F124